jgi:hypothetical protein
VRLSLLQNFRTDGEAIAIIFAAIPVPAKKSKHRIDSYMARVAVITG